MITSVEKLSDAGRYVCRASNDAGTRTMETRLVVNG